VGLAAVWNGDEHYLAEGLLEEALALDRELGSWYYGAYCLEAFAGVAGARGQGARAARLWGAAEDVRANIGAPLPLEVRFLYENSVAAARAQLGEAGWEAAFAQGMAMSAEEAAEYALSEEGPSERPPADGETDEPLTIDHLTRREREVAGLVAQGLSTRQIAQQLVISERTVDKHVANLLKKLNLRSRNQVATRMAEDRAQIP
jgi:DNA-binding CsgD family transcriptional regulator